MAQLKILTSFNIELDFDTAEFHKRLFAWAIDVIIVFVYFFTAIKLFSNLLSSESDSINGWAIFLILLLPMSLYPLVTEITMNGQTLGKKLMGIQVINETGGNATISQFLIRWMLRSSDIMIVIMIFAILLRNEYLIRALIFTVILAITDLACLVGTKKSQRLGDLAAGTILIKTKQKADLTETVFIETQDDYVPLYPEVMKLSDRDMNAIKNVLNALSKKSNWPLADRTAEKVQSILNIHSKQDSFSFLETLLKDYNHLSTK